MKKFLFALGALLIAASLSVKADLVSVTKVVNGVLQYIPLQGTTTGDAAPTGTIGEFFSVHVASSPGVTLSTGTAANIASQNLAAGDYDVWGSVCYGGQGSTAVTYFQAAATQSANTINLNQDLAINVVYPNAPTLSTFGLDPCYAVPAARLLLTNSGTAQIVAKSSFASGTLSAYGWLFVRRRR